MKNTWKRMLSALLCLAMLGGTLPAGAITVGQGSDLALGKTETVTVVNPLYAGTVTEADLVKPAGKGQMTAHAAESQTVYGSLEEATEYLRSKLVEREELITVKMSWPGVDASACEAAASAAMAHTGKGDEGDYLRYQYKGYTASISYSNCLTIQYCFTYYTNAAQEAEVDAGVTRLLDELDLYGGSRYEIVRGVYDWITANVDYDYANLNDDSYTMKFTAYAALFHRTSVCQGYALLLYRLLLELGVDCRIVTGTGNGGDHAWNIVQLDDLWYNADATWDAEWGGTYFLRCDANFGDHTRGGEFAAEKFYAEYPMAGQDFDPDLSDGGQPGEVGGGDDGENGGETGEPEDDSNVIASGGMWYCDLTWKLTEDGTLTVSGQGEMPRFGDCAPLPWAGLEEKIIKVVVEEGATNVGLDAFNSCYNLKEVTLADSVTSIDKRAFYECTSLTTIRMPAHLVSIGDLAFYLCDDLRKVDLGDSLVSIGECAFDCCRSLASITLPASLASVGGYAFRSCEGLREVKFMGEPPVFKNDGVFGGVTATAYYPEGSTAWPAAAKNYGGNLTWKTHDGSVGGGYEPSTSGQCGDDLTWMLNDRGVLTVVGTGDMWDYSTLEEPGWRYQTVKTVILTEGVTSIGDYAFYYCDYVENVSIPGSVTSIGAYAFYELENLVSLSIPEGVQTIGESAFQNCYGLIGLALPDSLTELGDNAFADCYYMRELDLGGGITAIGDYAFQNWTELTRVVIPDSVTSVGKQAFYGCSSLTSIEIPDSVTEVKGEIFGLCTSLVSVVLGDGVPYIPEGMFYRCSALTEVVMGSSVAGIYGEAFQGCDSLTSIEIPASVELLYNPFPACDNLTEINVDRGNETFCSVNGVVYTKDMRTLVCCPAGKSGEMLVPYTVTKIQDYAFYGCSKLTAVELENVYSIGSYAFAHCSGLGSIVFPYVLDYVATRAFIDCTGLQTVTFRGNVPRISTDALEGVTATCYYPVGYKDWQRYNSLNIGGFNGELSWCGVESGHVHSFSGERVDTINCEEPNYTVFTCECGESYVKYDSYADEHWLTGWMLQSDGVTEWQYCVLCMTEWFRVADGAEHTHHYAVTVTEPTCTQQGYTTYACSCGDSYRADFTGRAAHDFGAWTDLGDGMGKRVCEDCAGWQQARISGQCGDDLFWYLEGNTLIVEGEGAMWDREEFSLWAGTEITSVILTDGVTHIGANAFHGCIELAEVQILASVKTIGANAFALCPKLDRFVVDRLNDWFCVYDGMLLTKDKTCVVRCPVTKSGQVALPETVKTVGEGAFESCIWLTEVLFAEHGLTKVKDSAFRRCIRLKEITLPETLAEIGAYALANCDALGVVHFEGSLPVYAETVFYNTNFFHYTFPEEKFTYIGWASFVDRFDDWTGTLGGYNVTWSTVHSTHSYSAVETVEPTCSADGYCIYRCSECTETHAADYVATTGEHHYTAAVTAPTCTEDGYTTYTCAGCGDSYVGDRVEATGHRYGDWYVTKEPTEYEEGEERRDCAVCGHWEANVLESTGHKHNFVAEVVEPGCEYEGHTVYTCEGCGEYYWDDYTKPLGHSFGEWYVVHEGSCTSDRVLQRDCVRCGAWETDIIQPDCASARFVDVPYNAWYHSYVDFVVERGLMSGTSATTFAPTTVINRASVAVLLWNMAGKPEHSVTENPFSDVKENFWYTDAIFWAYENGVVSGNGAGGFNPNNDVTREQLAVMLYKFAEHMGYDLTAAKDVELASFPDGDTVSGWAASYLKWACDLGLINGKAQGGQNYLAPKDTATRAEIAVIFTNFTKLVEGN